MLQKLRNKSLRLIKLKNKATVHKIVKHQGEQIAKRQMFEQLFDDFYANRGKVYHVNFVRGIYFGLGSVLGGTVLVAILVWILSRLADWIPFVSELIKGFISTIQG